jgi:hypothetical protein
MISGKAGLACELLLGQAKRVYTTVGKLGEEHHPWHARSFAAALQASLAARSIASPVGAPSSPEKSRSSEKR